jgi:microcystin degradation protein MlrC
VALALHGAGVVEGIDDLEGDLCREVRAAVGPDTPIVVSLDLHGNMTQAMADTVTAMLGVHYYPHTDMYERGHEAVMLIPQVLSGTVKPVTHVEPIPMLIPPSSTNLDPAKGIVELCYQMEARPGMIDCAFFHGFPFCDTPLVRASVVATADEDRELARACAREVARAIWTQREALRPVLLTPKEAIAQALALSGGPVVINDTADNPGGGAPGDGTHLLRAMLEAKLDSACIGIVCDPEVAEAAHQAGAGATIEVKLGGKVVALHGAPVDVTAYVKCLSDGKFYMSGWEMSADHGKMARLQVGGIDILVSTIRGDQILHPEPFLLHGIDISRYKIVGVKSSQHFRAGFQPLARAIVTADSPGLTTLNVGYFPRDRTTRPIWPLDEDATYEG